VGSTALAGIPDKGRPGFISGLGEGARSEQAAQANQQAIKYKDFETQERVAQLHNDDLRIQNQTQAQQDAHIAAENTQRDYDDDHNIQFNPHPSDGGAVIQTLQARTQADPAGASIAPGSYHSADGNTIMEPDGSDSTNAGLTQKYKDLQSALGLPALQPGSQYVSGKNLDIMGKVLKGSDMSGKPLSKDMLQGYLSGRDSQRAELVEASTSPFALKTFDNLTNIYKNDLNNHQAFEDQATQAQAKAKAAGTLATQTSPDAINAAGAKAGAIAKAEQPYKMALQDNAAANKPQPDTTELNAVAYDPNYQNTDGTKGGNVVMSKADAAAKGLQHYKVDASGINSVVAGFNDVQNKINMLATVANDPNKMNQVQAPVAAAMLAHGKGIELGAFGTKLDTSSVNEDLYNANLREANQATRDYVTAVIGAHEAITQLPRLQTFGKSNRMTQQQMEAAQNLLPHPGDDGPMAQQKMVSLQQMLDPLRKQVPHMAGADSTPSWMEKQGGQQQRQAAPQQQAPAAVGSFNPQTQSIDYTNLP
jgi:hypothetical protein